MVCVRFAPYKRASPSCAAKAAISECYRHSFFNEIVRDHHLKKSREQLAVDLAEANKRLEQEKHKLYRLENRKSYLESGSRKQRNHRLITRGAAVESVMPDVKLLTEQEFYSLMERISEQPVVTDLVRLTVENHNQSQKDGG